MRETPDFSDSVWDADKVSDYATTELTTISGSLQQKQFLAALPESFSKSDAEHLANTLGLSVKTMNNWLTMWAKSLKIQHVAHGQYEKCA